MPPPPLLSFPFSHPFHHILHQGGLHRRLLALPLLPISQARVPEGVACQTSQQLRGGKLRLNTHSIFVQGFIFTSFLGFESDNLTLISNNFHSISLFFADFVSCFAKKLYLCALQACNDSLPRRTVRLRFAQQALQDCSCSSMDRTTVS